LARQRAKEVTLSPLRCRRSILAAHHEAIANQQSILDTHEIGELPLLVIVFKNGEPERSNGQALGYFYYDDEPHCRSD
jgi:hypothetical protein